MKLIEADQVAVVPSIEEGDAGIILKKDGSFQIFNTHKTINPEALTERQIEQSQILMGFAAALRLPQLMSVLTEVANDSTVFERVVEYPQTQ